MYVCTMYICMSEYEPGILFQPQRILISSRIPTKNLSQYDVCWSILHIIIHITEILFQLSGFGPGTKLSQLAEKYKAKMISPTCKTSHPPLEDHRYLSSPRQENYQDKNAVFPPWVAFPRIGENDSGLQLDIHNTMTGLDSGRVKGKKYFVQMG